MNNVHLLHLRDERLRLLLLSGRRRVVLSPESMYEGKAAPSASREDGLH